MKITDRRPLPRTGLALPLFSLGCAQVRYGDDGWADPLSFRPQFDYSHDGVLRSFEDSLQRLHVFALRHPQLPIVIDHAARPAIAHGSLLHWRREIAAHDLDVVFGGSARRFYRPHLSPNRRGTPC